VLRTGRQHQYWVFKCSRAILFWLGIENDLVGFLLRKGTYFELSDKCKILFLFDYKYVLKTHLYLENFNQVTGASPNWSFPRLSNFLNLWMNYSLYNQPDCINFQDNCLWNWTQYYDNTFLLVLSWIVQNVWFSLVSFNSIKYLCPLCISFTSESKPPKVQVTIAIESIVVPS
jgi:hypothetical protein